MTDKAAEIRQHVEPMRRSELIQNLGRPLSELRPIDLERILETLKTFHWDTGSAPSYDDQPSIGDLCEGFSEYPEQPAAK
ncbi:MAG TPA: hypothetical protein VES20_06940 [Bryobacteraceae bacterium]|nr:hypothetical protein [Bryobacteraceae bacterium]